MATEEILLTEFTGHTFPDFSELYKKKPSRANLMFVVYILILI